MEAMTVRRRSLEQRLDALERANAVRLGRADLRRKLATGELSATDLLADPPDAILTWQVGELLSAQWRWGGIRTRKFLASVGISAYREVRMLTERQRAVLTRALAA